MSNLSGIQNLDYYEVWPIADHILCNQANNLPLENWHIDNYANIIMAYDYTFYAETKTLEMA